MNNRFIKLLTFSADKNEVLLYGFSVSTKQDSYPWRKKKTKNKLKLNIYSAILSDEEAKQFEQLLTEEGDIVVGEMTLSTPHLIPRCPLLTYKNEWDNPDPVANLSLVSEFWNMQKDDLLGCVESGLGSSGKRLYCNMQELIFQIKAECGIDLDKNASRFGNYERYDCLDRECSLIVKIAENSDGKRIVIQKPIDWKRPLIINCTADKNDRILFNQIKELHLNEIEVEFAAEEKIRRYTVCAWDRDTGEIVFFESNVLLKINFTMNTLSTPRFITDPWSNSLLSAAANKSEIIHNQIEKVQPHSVFNTLQIGGKDDLFDNASSSSEQLFAPYIKKITKGAFIPNEQKDGEIASFLKIKEYLDTESVCNAIIADPYFSIPSAAKMLTRITNTNLELKIITSLTSIDPDSNQKADIIEEYRKFLSDHASILHSKLYVYNLCRVAKQVFHDRYLIRYHKNGTIDGFLLSNSLNSMGQFYPFVIAPLEFEVCRSVADYLNEICDPEIQKKVSKKLRITCDVLFDYKALITQKQQPKELNDWESDFMERKIEKSELSDIINELEGHYKDNPEEVCKVLSSLGGRTSHWSAKDLAAVLKKNRSMTDWYLEYFVSAASAIEKSRNHLKAGTNSYEYILWALLKGSVKPDNHRFTALFKNHYPVFYSGDNWMYGGYKLLLKLNANSYVALLEETCSPLMFSCLLDELQSFTVFKRMYQLLSKSKNKCIQLTAVCWYVYILEMGRQDPSDVLQFLNKLRLDIRLMQIAQMLSAGAFQIRCKKQMSDFWDSIFPQLLESMAETLSQCSSEERQSALDLVYDCEPCSYCALYLNLANVTSETEIKSDLLNRAIDIMKKEFSELKCKKDMTTHISLYLDCIEQIYGEQAENEMLKHFLEWEAFETAVEPEMKNYNHDRWRGSYLRACWQLDMLEAFLERHSQAEVVVKWLNTWKKRMEIIISEEEHLI